LSGISIIYNIYSSYSKNYCFHLVIGEHKENKNVVGKISFIYKFKFVYYIIVSIVALTLTLIGYLINNEGEEDFDLSVLKIF